jgi:hypothetical protein
MAKQQQLQVYDTGCIIPVSKIAKLIGGTAHGTNIFLGARRTMAEVIDGKYVLIFISRSLTPVHKLAREYFTPLDIDDFADRISANTG